MNTAGIFGWVFSLLTGNILLTWLIRRYDGEQGLAKTTAKNVEGKVQE